MSEYIVQAAEWAIDKNGNSLYQGCEEIVRCRDCKHYAPVKMADGTEEHRCSGAMAFVRCTPETFCAWAERKEGGDD